MATSRAVPKAYYNEIDTYCVEWLRNLIAEGLIADGDVDDRSIGDVRPNDIRGYTQCHFFAGLGGWPAALRLAGWPDHQEVWTGSCPCQPFSLAGKQRGFTDERHLWPFWRYLIAQRRPAKVYGEQVASASDWLRLVRGDLEALDYAVGAIPIEAASAGADHLRDRFWFVGDYPGERWGEGRPEHELRSGRDAAPGASSSITLANGEGGKAGSDDNLRAGKSDTSLNGILANSDDARSQGRQLLPECADQRIAGPDGVADSNSRAIRDEPGWSGWTNGSSAGIDRNDSERTLPDASGEQARARPSGQPRQHGGVEWVIGADGKARRVKSGVRLLAHGIPNRVAKLRALGNAIDLRPAAAFIQATA
jgi:DNA (cytosine-5)-methyltransferase 1